MRVSIPKKGLREALTAMSLIVWGKVGLPVLGCVEVKVRENRGEVMMPERTNGFIISRALQFIPEGEVAFA